ncbi:MAG: penicillin-binding protein activator [Gammaproteobacteria bacterium]
MHPLLNNTRRRFAFLLFALAAGCAHVESRGPQVKSYTDQQAVRLLESGKLEAAAAEFQRLQAISSAPESYLFGLRAADTYLKARRVEEARQILDRITIPAREHYLKVWHTLLSAQASLLSRDATNALAALKHIEGYRVPDELRPRYHRVLADAYQAKGDFLSAAREQVALDPYLADEKLKRANRLAIWETLHQVAISDLTQEQSLGSPLLRGWIDLALIARSDNDPSFEALLATWEKQYPHHPARQEALPRIREQQVVLNLDPLHVALLLPLFGQYAEAAAAIKDGFIAAWYSDGANSARRTLSIHDANAANALAVYRRALEEGSEFIVGPLDKQTLKVLVAANVITVPTLALNRIDGLDHRADIRYLYQFGLPPEDEAGQIAERAWLDGRLSALVLTPANAWGERLLRAFKQRWQDLGGAIVAQQTYHHDASNIETAVAQLMRASIRTSAPPTPLGEAYAASPSADFIFMAATPREARLILPWVSSLGRDRLPIYATSQVYSSAPAPEADSGLDGVIFGDMPWVLDPYRSELSASARHHWPKRFETHARLYALGIDAYRLMSRIGALQSDPSARLEGVTGILRIDERKRIRRQLAWAQFLNGVPALLRE